jgi:REP element-mobilizing transposase RayT
MGYALTGHTPERHHRCSIRLPGYDYASPGAYFVTVCAHDQECIFDVPELRDAVEEAWRQIPFHFPNARLDESVVMPNHIHGIVRIVGAQHAAPLPAARTPTVKPGSLGAVVRSFKSAATKRVNQIRRTPGALVWQRNYYERVIRNEDELSSIREYTHLNPLKWELDHENPHRVDSREYTRQWGWLEGVGSGGAARRGGRPYRPISRPGPARTVIP